MKKAKVRGEERERLKGGRIQRRVEKGKGKCAHVKSEGRHSPCSWNIFVKLSLPNGEGLDRQASIGGRDYSRYSKRRKCNLSSCSWSRQPRLPLSPSPGSSFSQDLIHHYPIAKSAFFSHVHVPLEPPSEFLPRCVPQPSCQSQPRRYRQVLHPVWRKLGRRHISLSYRLWQLLQWYRVVKLLASRHILRMQRLQFVR